jgi:hypothetical protein
LAVTEWEVTINSGLVGAMPATLSSSVRGWIGLSTDTNVAHLCGVNAVAVETVGDVVKRPPGGPLIENASPDGLAEG